MVYPPALVLCNFATTYHSFYTTFFPTFQPKPPHRAELPRKKGRSRKNHSQLFFDKNTTPLPVSGKGGCIGFYGKGLSLPFFPRQPPVQQPGSVHEAGCCLFQPLLIFPQKKSPAALTGLLHPQMCMQYTQPDSSTKNRQVLVFPFFPKTAKGTQAVLPQFFWMFFLLFLEIVLILAKAIFDWAVIPIRERISSPAVPTLPSGLWRAGPGRKYPVRCSPPRKAGR